MLALLIRRILFIIPILFLVSVMVFGFVHLVPGDPAITIAGENASPEVIADIRANLGLDRPIVQQYGTWVGNAVQGDLGRSLFSGREVVKSIGERLPVTLSLAALSIVIALVIAIPAGTLAAMHRGRWLDSMATVGASLGLAMPSFWLGLVLVLVFCQWLSWLPPTGYIPLEESVVQWARHLLLPALTLGAAAAAETTRQLRASLIDVFDQDYVRTARAKGLRSRAVIFRHGMKNAASPVITVLGFQVAFLLGGSVIVEQLFTLPGLGGLAVRAVLDRDLPVIQGVVLFAAVLVIGVNLIVDLCYGWLNPKVRVR